MTTPIDHEAAGRFNAFFYTRVERVADADDAPQWFTDSPDQPRP